MKTLITLALFVFAWTAFAEEAGALSRRLSVRMGEIIFEEPLVLVGKTSEQQFMNVLEQISDRYEKRWEEPLPVAMDLTAIRHLRRHPDLLSSITGGAIKSVPLTEMLRLWCGMAELETVWVEGRIVILVRKK